MADGPAPTRAHLAAVPAATPTRTPALPGEADLQPEDAPSLLAALDAGDEEAVYAWVRAHTPETTSLVLQGLYIGAGIAGLVEWPAVVLALIGQVIVDRRFGGVEALAAELRARVDGALPARA
ncbi:hypothetical protein [Actinomycetospora cinnamomea]|uniref:Uncharacterized protein n=1 Tax=Actinomycetospora cinnamomea TaxID=663609 RepID=A0A2U1FIT7_9PSEU|nr:hypothetical protein [Actinomycetospora cinnamomea]PVZ12088.1 hypothetical protein C8D89_103419 [Actinomycetospora cinnamomea]